MKSLSRKMAMRQEMGVEEKNKDRDSPQMKVELIKTKQDKKTIGLFSLLSYQSFLVWYSPICLFLLLLPLLLVSGP